MNKTKQKIDVVVIGGGASGMMAAGRAGELGRSVVVLEKNNALGEKLKITGGGRCNITNAQMDIHKLLENFKEAKDYLYAPFSIFGVKETFEFFESRGLPLVIENNFRAFPKSQKALDVYNVLEKYIKDNKVMIHLGKPVIKISVKNKKIISVETEKHIFFPEKVIVATGGVSHPETGSSRDGFKWLSDLGHTVKDPTPDIVPISVKEEWVKKLSGLAFDDIRITFYLNKEKKFKKEGRLLCTHFGLSGPMILNSASMVSDLLHEGEVTARVDLFPKKDAGIVDRELTSLFDEHKNKLVINVLANFVPKGLTQVLPLIFKDINFDVEVNNFRKEDRKTLVQGLKNLNISVKGLMGHDRAVVSDGGVLLSEIDLKTMQSKKCENLYITGDLLHISRPSGGYSLQLCWTTGYIAGSSV